MNKNTLLLVLLVIVIIVLLVLILKDQTESFMNKKKYIKVNAKQCGVIESAKRNHGNPYVSLYGWVSSDTLKDKKLRHLFNNQYKKTRCCETPLISKMPKYKFHLPKGNQLMARAASTDNNRKGTRARMR
tara:strand:- start:467 stop:856 length:390 start_codon:yes stop_codon:yes gene_type:complete